MGKKIWLTIHPRKFGGEVSVPRPSVHSSVVMEGNQVSACRGRGNGGEYVINCAMYLCNRRFSWREIGQEMAWQSRRVQKPVYSIRNFFSSTLNISICDRSAQFLANCFAKKIILTNNSGFNSIYMFACK